MNAKASEPIDNLSRILDAQDLSPLAKCSKEKRGEAVPKVILYKSRGETFFLNRIWDFGRFGIHEFLVHTFFNFFG